MMDYEGTKDEVILRFWIYLLDASEFFLKPYLFLKIFKLGLTSLFYKLIFRPYLLFIWKFLNLSYHIIFLNSFKFYVIYY
jgi:hypothetical protein